MTDPGSVQPPFNMVDVICAKRDGGQLSHAHIREVIRAYVAGDIPDYQMSALLMAIVFRGLTRRETLSLTTEMVASGDTIDLSAIGRKIVDKHSTGGVGDKVSIALGPIVAACGVPFAKMSGRGLGHTGGTLDKLESIPGFQIELAQDEFINQVRDIGLAIVGQTVDLVPADKKLYALRDVTGTVESIPLIAASVMSKKIAAGADAIVLDVKVGSGAFMKTIEDARELADEMIEIGHGAGRAVHVLISDMSQPLGTCVGNAIEIIEVLELLDGGGSAILREIVVTAAGVLLSLSDLGLSYEDGLQKANEAIDTGAAREKFDTWIAAQGGDLSRPLELAPVVREVTAPGSGFITEVDALTVGHAVAALGGAREVQGTPIDHGVGVRFHHVVGDEVHTGDVLCEVYARSEAAADQAELAIGNSVVLSANPPKVAVSAVREHRGDLTVHA